MKSKLLQTIEYGNDLGYSIKINNEFTQKRITCIYKDNTSFSSVIPEDHFFDETVIEVIKFNIKRHNKGRNIS